MNEDEGRNRLLSEEYECWKQATPFLYDIVLAKVLKWPSLTIEWLPEEYILADNSISKHILLGTHTSEQEPGAGADPNHVIIAEVNLPVDNVPMDCTSKYDDDMNVSGNPARVEIEIMINHPGEVNRARCLPQRSSIIATKTNYGDVLIFDYLKHPKKPKDEALKPEIILKKGRKSDGFGLSWNPIEEGIILSASYDHTISYWDIRQTTVSSTLNALLTFKKHNDAVADVAWHPKHSDYFGSVGDDRKFMLWDMRKPNNLPAYQITAHEDTVNCLSFSPFSEFIFATGSNDKMVFIWDLRLLKTPIYILREHASKVGGVTWSPHSETVLCSFGDDRRINFWDLSKIGEQPVSYEDSDDGPPELIFIHGGHSNIISDFAWDSKEQWLCGSVSDDNILQIWKVVYFYRFVSLHMTIILFLG